MAIKDLNQARRLIKTLFFTPMGNSVIDDTEQEQWGMPVVLVSPPGASKTSIIRELMSTMRFGKKDAAGVLQPTKVPFLAYEPGAVGEAGFGGTPMPQQLKTRNAAGREEEITVFDFPPMKHFVEKFDGDTPGALFLDEMSTARGQQHDALLTCLQQGKIGTYYLNPRVRRIGAMNPSDQTAGGEETTCAVNNRVCWLDYPDPSLEEWTSHMVRGGKLHETSEEDIIDVDAEEARVLKEIGPHYARSSALFSGWLKTRQQLRSPAEKMETQRSWVSPRSLSNAVRVYATAMLYGLSQQDTNLLLEGIIGAEALAGFTTWCKSSDLPDIDLFLQGRAKFEHSLDRLERTVAVLAGCRARLRDPSLDDGLKRSMAANCWKFAATVVAGAGDVLVPLNNDMWELGLAGMPEARDVIKALKPVIAARKAANR